MGTDGAGAGTDGAGGDRWSGGGNRRDRRGRWGTAGAGRQAGQGRQKEWWGTDGAEGDRWDGVGTEEAGDDRQGTGQHHRVRWGRRGPGPQTGRGTNRALTVPLFEAILPNCYLILGLKHRTPSPGLDLHLPSLRHPSGGLWGCPAMSLGELGVLSGWSLGELGGPEQVKVVLETFPAYHLSLLPS